MKDKIIVLGIVLVFLLSVTIGMASTLSNSGGGDWSYYKEITVKENSGKTLTNFQVLIELNSANFDFSKAKSDDKAAELAKKDIAKGLNKAKKYSPISVASATSPKEYYFSHDDPNDPYDMTKEIFVGDPLEYGWEKINLKMLPQPLNERIRTPDEISREILEKGSTTIKLSPTEFSILLGPTSGNSPIEEGLVCVKINGRPELLIVYKYPYANFADKFEPDIKGHFIDAGFGHYVVYPHNKPKNHDELSSLQNMVYVEDIESIELLGKTIPWKEAYNKSLAEIFDERGLDKDDRGIFGGTPSQTSSPAESTPSEVPKGEEKGISGFDAINSLRIEVQKDGDADFSAQYSLSRWEQFYLWIKGALGDRDATKNHIESKIESNLERGVESLEISEDGRASFVLKDYVGKVERNEGTWYWTKIYLSEDACEKINLGTVSVIFPDGFIYEFDGKLPNIKHLGDKNLAKLYLEAKYTKEIYKNIKPLYFQNGYCMKGSGKFLEKIYLELGKSIVASPIPYSEFADLINLAKDIKGTMEQYHETLDYMVEICELSGERFSPEVRSSYLPTIGWDIKDMVELKEEEINLIYSITTDPEKNDELRKSLIEKLIENLEKQKEKIVLIKGSAYDIYISETDSSGVKKAKEYINGIFKNARDLANTDLKYVGQCLTTLKEEKEK